MLDQTDHDFLQPRVWAVLVTRYDFVGQSRGDVSSHFIDWWLGCIRYLLLRTADTLLTHASHPDPFEANGMPPTYDSAH
jgi:hypothetical protein